MFEQPQEQPRYMEVVKAFKYNRKMLESKDRKEFKPVRNGHQTIATYNKPIKLKQFTSSNTRDIAFFSTHLTNIRG